MLSDASVHGQQTVGPEAFNFNDIISICMTIRMRKGGPNEDIKRGESEIGLLSFLSVFPDSTACDHDGRATDIGTSY